MIPGRQSRLQPISALLAFVAMMFAAGVVQAQTLSVDIQQSAALDLGKVVGGASGNTVFRISPSGTVTVASGTGSRTSSGSVTAPSVVVKCTNASGHNCSSYTIYLTLKGTGRSGTVTATPTNFELSSGSMYAESGSTTIWRLGTLTSGINYTYTLGMDVPIGAAAATTGSGTFSFSAAVGTSSSGSTSPIDTGGTGALTTIKQLSITKNVDLAFGRVVKPTSGSSTVTVTGAGVRTITGGGVIISSPFSAANYTVTGQASQSVSITSSSFNMTNPTNDTLLVTPSLPVGLTAIGSGGTYTFSVGGAFTMTSTTPTGLYTGNFSVSASYN